MQGTTKVDHITIIMIEILIWGKQKIKLIHYSHCKGFTKLNRNVIKMHLNDCSFI